MSALAKAIATNPAGLCFDAESMQKSLDANGYSVLHGVLDREACQRVAASYSDGSLFRSRVVMARHGFGRGEYQYFDYPLPQPIARLREDFYEAVVGIANRWNESMQIDARYPHSHAEYLQRCHRLGQVRPTPLLLRYGAGDYNCLHQDLYGDEVFPLQMAILLSAPGEDFTGGEFALTEQRPRMQSRVSVVPLGQGDAVVFPVHHRPVRGTRGVYRVNMRHGVSEVRTGSRSTLGIILHDAK